MGEMSGRANLEPLKKAKTAGGCRLKTRHARYIGNYPTKTPAPMLARLSCTRRRKHCSAPCAAVPVAGWLWPYATSWVGSHQKDRLLVGNRRGPGTSDCAQSHVCWDRLTAPPCRIPNLGSFPRQQCNSQLPCLPCPKNREMHRKLSLQPASASGSRPRGRGGPPAS